jgi:hypothetical protein
VQLIDGRPVYAETDLVGFLWCARTYPGPVLCRMWAVETASVDQPVTAGAAG